MATIRGSLTKEQAYAIARLWREDWKHVKIIRGSSVQSKDWGVKGHD